VGAFLFAANIKYEETDQWFSTRSANYIAIAIAMDAVSNLTTRSHQSSAPLLNNDRVVQRRRAGSSEFVRPGLDSFDSICWGP
jgi:hypothetical protein